MLKNNVLRAAALAIAAFIGQAHSAEGQSVSVPAGDLTVALETLAKQAGVELVYRPEQLKGLQTKGVQGQLSSEEAVRKLLEGTTLTLRADPSGVLLISTAASPPKTSADSPQIGVVRQARVDDTRDPRSPSEESSSQSRTSNSSSGQLDEVVVTGTHIRGGASASPLTILDRSRIEATGYSSIDQVTESLPQIFGGGAQQDTSFGDLSRESRDNISRGSTINMRGLGAHASLVLLDGHRLPGSGPGQVVDISMIPLSAVERIEVLSDGASAVYGSDAVAGVVNIVTRKHFDGLGLKARHGIATQGGYLESQGELVVGRDDDRGDILFSYVYVDRDNLDSEDRKFSRAVIDPVDLFGAAETHSFFLSGAFMVSERTRLYSRNYASSRDNDRVFTTSGRTNRDLASAQQFGVSAGASHEWHSSWTGDLFASYGENTLDNHLTRISPPSISTNDYDQNHFGLEASVDGPLGSLPAGEVRLALGSSFRREHFEQLLSNDPAGTFFSDSRTVLAAYAEMLVPVLSPSSRLGRLESSFAVRHEEHSDFGSSADPKIGLSWSPIEALRLRTTYGRSFRAPTFTEIVAQYELAALLQLPDPTSPSGSTLTLYRPYGANPDLHPETAKTWTAGIDYTPVGAADLSISTTYFDIAYSDRITQPIANVLGAFANESRYAAVIDRTPDPALVAELISRPFTGATGFLNQAGPFVPADIAAIIDNRYHNVFESTAKGIDAVVEYSTGTRLGDMSTALTATYLIDFDQSLGGGVPSIDLLNTVGQPIDLRVRADFGLRRGALGINGAVNYADSYTNVDVTPNVPVDSWTTVDFRISVEPRNPGGLLEGFQVALNLVNAFDEKPPWVSNSLNLQLPLGYDPTNASPLGRMISLELRNTF